MFESMFGGGGFAGHPGQQQGRSRRGQDKNVPPLYNFKNSDIVTFYILSNLTTKLHIKIENKEKRTHILTVLKLLDIDEDILDIPNIEFDTVKTMPSNDFQSYIRELSIITNKITLESKKNTFSLIGEGDFICNNR